jgi:hypothetical protein
LLSFPAGFARSAPGQGVQRLSLWKESDGTMRVRTWSACVALAWGIVLIVTAAGPSGSLRPAQATTRTANITSTTRTTRSTSSTRPAAPVSGRASGPAPVPAPTHRTGHAPSAKVPSPGGLPRWLEIVLAAAGLLIATAFLTEPAFAIARRCRGPRPAGDDRRIVLADYERLVVTHNRQDGTVYVLRPPDADPEAILLAARLVLAQDRYEELAGHLGVPAHWPTE